MATHPHDTLLVVNNWRTDNRTFHYHVWDSTIRLDHVVNVIENSTLVGNQAGWISIFNVPNVLLDLQVYGLSFNSANPAGDPNLTWDAIFEAYIVTDDAI